MLVEFRVKNFRSIRDEQVLSLVASNDDTHRKTHVISSIPGTPDLLPTAVIYGANASGKSNLIQAFLFMRTVVTQSASMIHPGPGFNLKTFCLDKNLMGQPAEFEVVFIENDVRYRYGFAITSERIVEEWLFVYKTAKQQCWFSRQYNPETLQDDYEMGASLKGERQLWRKSTRSNALFLSTAVQLNSQALEPVFSWFQKLIIVQQGLFDTIPQFSSTMSITPFSLTTRMISDSPHIKKVILQFLQTADLSIQDISVKKFNTKLPSPNPLKDTKSVETESPASLREIEFLLPQFHHITENGSAILEYQDESMGTQHFYSMIGLILTQLQNNQILIMDELNNSLHPLLVDYLIRLYHNPALNKRGAQLIFTTHDTSLLNSTLFRRDQIWFTEKDHPTQATKLYPLSDFHPRKGEALEKNYLFGRYGAIPFLQEPVLEDQLQDYRKSL